MTDLQIPQGEHLENGRSLAGRPLKTLLIGTGIGALTGLAAALIMNRRAAKTGGEINLTAGDGIRMGLLVLGLLRSITSIGDEG